MDKESDPDSFYDGCRDYFYEVLCWLDEECQGCGELNYRCECDHE